MTSKMSMNQSVFIKTPILYFSRDHLKMAQKSRKCKVWETLFLLVFDWDSTKSV
jgi:hypothetical protein